VIFLLATTVLVLALMMGAWRLDICRLVRGLDIRRLVGGLDIRRLDIRSLLGGGRRAVAVIHDSSGRQTS
jgi:hypothetical protein